MNNNPFKEYKEEIKKLEARIEVQKEQIFAWTQLSQTAINEMRSNNLEMEILRSALAYASGIISTLPEYQHYHPEQVMAILKAYGVSSATGSKEEEVKTEVQQ